MFPRPKEVKHIACSRCRERKVKCDGGKPTCRRCERLGHECRYIQGKKHQGKGEWTQHLGMFNAQPGKKASATSSPAQRHISPPPDSAQSNSTVEIPETEPTLQYSQSSSPYLILSSSQPESMVPDAESPFSNSESMDAWVPPVPSSASFPVNDDVLDSHMFAFSPSQLWCDASYTSDLITTNPEGMGPTSGWDMKNEQEWGGNMHSAFNPSMCSSRGPNFSPTTNTTDWRPHYMSSSPISHRW